jgi:hypothetical protein
MRRALPTSRLRLAGMSAALASVVLLAGACTDAEEPDDAAGQTPAAESEAEAAEEPPTGSVTQFTDHPGTADDGFVGARSDVTDLTCEPGDDGAWQASGLVTSSASSTADYRIYVVFLKDSDTRGIVQADVADVAPAEARPWETELALPGEEGLRCELRVERVDEA